MIGFPSRLTILKGLQTIAYTKTRHAASGTSFRGTTLQLNRANSPVLDILLDIRVDKVPTDQSLGVENGVLGVRGSLVLGGVSDQSFVGGESDP